jgi:hypothetical protein
LKNTSGSYENNHIKDPEELTGTREEKLEALRDIRNQIRKKVSDYCHQYRTCRTQCNTPFRLNW